MINLKERGQTVVLCLNKLFLAFIRNTRGKPRGDFRADGTQSDIQTGQFSNIVRSYVE